ncbi:MAG: alpha-L-arabinofuranosidase C-terminal domain-containing protein, partial [Lachnospiraceae bacterium]|nr:alpha-L-arabinofuranosidase C-terminal domain-containing protein [Lachnospiraceae bacterium]
YKDHQDNELVDSSIETKTIGLEEEYMVPNLNESVSKDKEGNLHITINNLSLEDSEFIEGVLADVKIQSVEAEILTQKMDAYNDFEHPDVVKKQEFNDIKINGDNRIEFTIPPCSVMHIKVVTE